MTADELAVRLRDLWDVEYGTWEVKYHDGFGENPWPWDVVLTWASEYGNAHDADWVEYTWQFAGPTIEEALTEAVQWCEGLLPFKRCGACDGQGWYGGAADPKRCDECGGSGRDKACQAENEKATDQPFFVGAQQVLGTDPESSQKAIS